MSSTQAAEALPRRASASWLSQRLNLESGVMAGALALVAALAVIPMLVFFQTSFRIYTEAGPEGFTLQNYYLIFSEPLAREAIWNTVLIALFSAVFSGALGTSLAWFHARTDMPLRRWLEPLTLMPFFLPSLVGAIAWWALASPKVGMLNTFLVGALGLSEAPFNIYTLWGIVWVLVLFDTPYMYLFTIGSFNRMDPSLEESARVCGTGVFKTALRVTLPLSLPAILSGVVIIFVTSAGVFGVPIVLGGPGRVHTLSTQMYTKMGTFPPEAGVSAAAGCILMIITAFGLWIQRKIIAPRSFVTVTGKGYRPARMSLGPWRYLALALNLLYVLAAVVLPVGALLMASLNRNWFGMFRWEQFTLRHWQFILFEYDYTLRAIKNSMFLGIAGGFLAVVLCTFLSILIHRGRNRRFKSVLDYITTLPIGVPGIVMGMAFLITWIRTPLYAFPMFLLILGYMTRYMPYGIRTISSVLLSVSPELEESSRVCGATFLRTLRRVTVPLLQSGIFAAYLLLFIVFIRELPVSALLATEASTPMALALYIVGENDGLGVVSAFALVQIVLLLGATYLFRRLWGLEKLSV
ncbi:MAG: iron ABC transporter permease [Candidatus Tectomicrobia bacterium]|uniref:Iron ABC transporter permease n=1 Tax=Tectimicrobiota bacterium TaxID=2528274 RepID=A0A932MMU8_UNCTE|nr:iron ABC transporter permease [Candidatus Tectomicrobia bacterium]